MDRTSLLGGSILCGEIEKSVRGLFKIRPVCLQTRRIGTKIVVFVLIYNRYLVSRVLTLNIHFTIFFKITHLGRI